MLPDSGCDNRFLSRILKNVDGRYYSESFVCHSDAETFGFAQVNFARRKNLRISLRINFERNLALPIRACEILYCPCLLKITLAGTPPLKIQIKAVVEIVT